MSMLAERKQKVHWVLDPRETEWSKDQNKFGQKMLEKMGWSPGKGLGANEQGITNALRIKYKSDTKGLGCKDPKYEWVKQQQDFDNLLSTLSTDINEDDKTNEEKEAISVQSLEEKSKKTKTKVFYHKQIKGKDLSRYSAEDLKCILGFGKGAKVESEDNVSEEPVKIKKKKSKKEKRKYLEENGYDDSEHIPTKKEESEEEIVDKEEQISNDILGKENDGVEEIKTSNLDIAEPPKKKKKKHKKKKETIN